MDGESNGFFVEVRLDDGTGGGDAVVPDSDEVVFSAGGEDGLALGHREGVDLLRVESLREHRLDGLHIPVQFQSVHHPVLFFVLC